jgi:hypothetical protein
MINFLKEEHRVMLRNRCNLALVGRLLVGILLVSCIERGVAEKKQRHLGSK